MVAVLPAARISYALACIGALSLMHRVIGNPVAWLAPPVGSPVGESDGDEARAVARVLDHRGRLRCKLSARVVEVLVHGPGGERWMPPAVPHLRAHKLDQGYA